MLGADLVVTVLALLSTAVLQTASAARNGVMPVTDNPLVAYLNRPDVQGGSGWGLSYLQAIVDVATGQPPHVTFAILAAALTALQVAAALRMASFSKPFEGSPGTV